jgi:hypothetical protein
MKRIKTIGLVVTLMMIFFGCEKIKDPAGLRNSGAIPTISDVSPGIFINGDNNSYIQFVVKSDSLVTVDKTEIVVFQQDTLKRVKIAELTTSPATVHITLGEVLNKLGLTTVNNGDIIYVEVVTTKNGLTTRSNAALSISIVCEFDRALTFGSYKSFSAPTEWSSAGNVTITPDANDPYTVYVAGLEALEGFNEDLGPLPMHINPTTFAVTVDPTIIVSAGDYGTIQYGGNGTYNSCDGSYAMNFDITLGAYGPQGKMIFSLTRK